MKLFNSEQADFIKNNYKGINNEALTKLVNEKFGSDFSVKQIKSFKRYRKLDSGLPGGFKKGEKSINKHPVGSERISPDGYTRIKVANPSRWINKHKYLYEKNIRKLNKGELVIFLNGDKTDFSLENLAAVTRGELAQLNKLGFIQSDREFAIAGLNIIRIKDKLKEETK